MLKSDYLTGSIPPEHLWNEWMDQLLDIYGQFLGHVDHYFMVHSFPMITLSVEIYTLSCFVLVRNRFFFELTQSLSLFTLFL